MHGEHGTTGPPSTIRETVPRNRADDPRRRRARTVPRNRLHVGLIATTIIALSLAACTGDPAPVGSPPDGGPVTSASAAATPEPTRPVEAATPESAIQFTRYFWDLYNYAYQTYDTAPLKAISDPGCKYCASTITDVARIAAARTRIEDHFVIFKEASSPPVAITTGTVVIAINDQRPGRAISPTGEAIRLKGSRGKRFTFALAWKNDHWQIEGIDYDTESGIPWDG